MAKIGDRRNRGDRCGRPGRSEGTDTMDDPARRRVVAPDLDQPGREPGVSLAVGHAAWGAAAVRARDSNYRHQRGAGAPAEPDHESGRPDGVAGCGGTPGQRAGAGETTSVRPGV